jgi:hypothetical protein
MKNLFVLALVGTAIVGGAIHTHAQAAPLPYKNDFTQTEQDKVPDDLMVLDGGFTVKEEGGNKFLELPGAPLDTFGVLFGPAVGTDVRAAARFHGTGKGRRFPAFALGINGQGGLKLQVAPSKKKVELFKGDELLAEVPLEWQSGKWTQVRLESRAAASGGVDVIGKVWQEGQQEPKEPTIKTTLKEKLPEGRAVIWGNPFSGTPIRFDDLVLEKLAGS